MARTVEEVLQQMIGQQVAQIAISQVKIEQLTEALAAKDKALSEALAAKDKA